jgi:choline kinase/thiamine kinase-like enzyme
LKYKVCILAAGEGKRLLPLTKNFNKALLPLRYKAAISHIIEKFPKNIEIVVAIGHEKKKVSEYLLCAHTDRKIKLVNINNFSGPGSGPGYSLLLCKNYLKCPFIFFSVDTIVDEDIPLPNYNWMGIAPVKNTKEYCSVLINKNLISDLYDKKKTNNKNIFIGLAGIKDYKFFFENLKKNKMLIQNEIQVSNGFRALIKKKLYPIPFSWYDIGNKKGYDVVKKKFSKNEEFNFEKTNEFLYFINNKVIKYFQDKSIINKRYTRSLKLGNLCPKIECKTKFFYFYKKVRGHVIYDTKKIVLVKKLLLWLNKYLWKKKNLSNIKIKQFRKACKLFYYNKTLDRIEAYYSKHKSKNFTQKINGKTIESAENLISRIDFEWLSDGIPARFHGDLQFENILYSKKDKFILLDWRQDFSGLLDYGDIYYDLAKLNGGIYISYKKIKKGLFSYKENLDNVLISTPSDPFLRKSKKIFDNFIYQKKLDIIKIEILTGIIFLNMAAMHHEPFSHFIFHLGRYKIHKWINIKNLIARSSN